MNTFRRAERDSVVDLITVLLIGCFLGQLVANWPHRVVAQVVSHCVVLCDDVCMHEVVLTCLSFGWLADCGV